MDNPSDDGIKSIRARAGIREPANEDAAPEEAAGGPPLLLEPVDMRLSRVAALLSPLMLIAGCGHHPPTTRFAPNPATQAPARFASMSELSPDDAYKAKALINLLRLEPPATRAQMAKSFVRMGQLKPDLQRVILENAGMIWRIGAQKYGARYTDHEIQVQSKFLLDGRSLVHVETDGKGQPTHIDVTKASMASHPKLNAYSIHIPVLANEP